MLRVIRSPAAALFCRIGEKSVWLSRAGDRGRLFVCRSVVVEHRIPEEPIGAGR